MAGKKRLPVKAPKAAKSSPHAYSRNKGEMKPYSKAVKMKPKAGDKC